LKYELNSIRQRDELTDVHKFPNNGFADCACVVDVDGTEIRISCPSNKIFNPEPGVGKRNKTLLSALDW
jgi:hypothetical protein